MPVVAVPGQIERYSSSRANRPARQNKLEDEMTIRKHDYCGKCRALRQYPILRCKLGYKLEKPPGKLPAPLEWCPKPMSIRVLRQYMNRSIFD